MGRLIKSALYSYRYEEDRRLRELDRKRKLIQGWLEPLKVGWDKSNYHGRMKVIRYS